MRDDPDISRESVAPLPGFFIGLIRLKENLDGFQGDLGINFLMICFLKLNN
jgi:hypothetical protein